MAAGSGTREAWDEYGFRPRVVHASQSPREPLEPHLTYFYQIEAVRDVADFVEGLLIAAAMSVVYGESNSGKTFFATDLALHVATGRQWRGREVDAGGVLYCALEGTQGIANRIAAWKLEHFSNGHAAGSELVPFAVLQTSVNLLDPDADTEPLIELIATAPIGAPVKLIIIDTLFRAIAGGNENASEDMGLLVANADRIRRATGAHVMFIHHSGKDAARGARGHSSLLAATDTEIEVTYEEGTRTASVTKQRDLDCAGEFPFTLKVVELGENRRGKPVTSCVVEVPPENAGAKHAPKISGHNRRAFDILTGLLGQAGAINPETHTNIPSIGEQYWREAFYQDALPGAPLDTKKRAFRRAADHLVELRLVAMSASFVWVVQHNT